jgi:hypothetical protein
VTTIASGIMEGSRFGLRGSEDIGGGYKAIFTLENRFELDTGSVTNRPNSGTQMPDRVATSVAAGRGRPSLPVATRDALIAGVNTHARHRRIRREPGRQPV